MKDLDMKAIHEFGISGVKSIIRIENKDMWIIDDKYVVKSGGTTDDDLKHLEKGLLINTELYKAGVQIPKYYEASTGKLYVKTDAVYYTLTDKAQGFTEIDMYSGDYQKRAFSIGKGIAKLHIALKELTGRIEFYNGDFMNEYHGWMSREIKDKNIGINQEILDYLAGFEDLYYRLPRQIIHRDLHDANMLVDNDEITAFIDFNSITQVNVRMFDLCYYSYSFGWEKWDDDKKSMQWIEILKNLLSGYNSVSEIATDELDSLPYLFTFISLLWIAFTAMNGGSVGNVENIWAYDNRHELLFSKQDIANINR